MKPLTALYPRLSAFSNLREAARSAERGKRFHADVLAFNMWLDANLFLPQHELRGAHRCADRLSRSGGAPCSRRRQQDRQKEAPRRSQRRKGLGRTHPSPGGAAGPAHGDIACDVWAIVVARSACWRLALV